MTADPLELRDAPYDLDGDGRPEQLVEVVSERGDLATYHADPAQGVSCSCPEPGVPDPARDPRCPGLE